jgi:hypothetical protein
MWSKCGYASAHVPDANMGPVGLWNPRQFEGETCGIRHLAKNERDVGHPATVVGIEPKGEFIPRLLALCCRCETQACQPDGVAPDFYDPLFW